MRGLAGRLWRGFFFTVLALSFLSLFPVYVLMLWMDVPHRRIHALRRHHTRITCRATGIRFRLEGDLPDLDQRPAILCANHASYLDILGILSTISSDYRFLGKMELNAWPAFGYFFRKMDITVNRLQPREAARAFGEASRAMERGESVVFFPEGTIPDDAPRLADFKDGAFRLAAKSGRPILPIAILGSQEALPWGQPVGKPKTIILRTHALLEPPEKEPQHAAVPLLKQGVYGWIESQLKGYYEDY